MPIKPSVFVFDLDFTLWDAGGTWCDCTMPPYKNINNHIVDFHGRTIVLYEDVKAIFEHIKSKKKIIAIASRTSAPNIAREFIERFKLSAFIDIQEIYPTGKRAHLSRIIDLSNTKPNQIVFFDDEMRNIRDVQSMGIESIHIKNGICMKHLNPYL